MARVISGVITGTAAALGEITIDPSVTSVILKITTSGTETVSVTGLLDVSTYTNDIMFFNLATGAVHSATAIQDITVYLDPKGLRSLKFTGSGSSDTKTVTYLLKHD